MLMLMFGASGIYGRLVETKQRTESQSTVQYIEEI